MSQVTQNIKKQSIHLVLEGGGAKGIAHVAALDAIERTKIPGEYKWAPELAIEAVGGSSIGAIVAAFVAAGASSEELIDKNGHIPIAEKAIGLPHLKYVFGYGGWRMLRIVRWVLFSKFSMPVLSVGLVLVFVCLGLALRSFDDLIFNTASHVIIFLTAYLVLTIVLRVFEKILISRLDATGPGAKRSIIFCLLSDMLMHPVGPLGLKISLSVASISYFEVSGGADIIGSYLARLSQPG